MTTTGEPRNELYNRIDFLVMIGAIIALFIALGSEPWWTLTGTTTSRLFSIQVSPFFVHISATGLPSIVPFASGFGAFTRTFLLLGFLTLFAASIRPTAWWRNLAVYFGLSSLAELYLSFLLMYYWAETAFFNAYGIVPPFSGTTVLSANILGLDLAYYASPLVTATFGLTAFLGLVSISAVYGRTLIKILHQHAFQVLAALLPGGGIRDIYLTPPYSQVWFSSGDKEYNPMQVDPEGLTDDQLLISFEKLYKTVEPGGSLSIILPTWATRLTDRLEKLLPQTGFTVEKTGTVYRTEGRPENELRFRRPIEQILQSKPAREAEETTETVEKVAENLTSPIASLPSTEDLKESVPPPVLEVVPSEPVWVDTRITRLERSMLRSAIRAINEHQQPMPYRELLNEVYMDLVDHQIEFDSARQIETTLLKHNGRELEVIEDTDEATDRSVRKWTLGQQKLRPERTRKLPSLGLGRVKPKLSKVRNLIKRPSRSRYKSRANKDEDSSE